MKKQKPSRTRTHILTKLLIPGTIFLTLLITALLLDTYQDIHQKKPSEQTVLLSFDVEPVSGKTVLDIIEVLDRTETGATFFVTGQYAEEHPNIIKRLSKRYEIGCHTYSHKKLTGLDKEGKKEEIIKCKKTVSRIIGKNVVGFRAPWHQIELTGLMILDEKGFYYDASVISGLGWMYPAVDSLYIGEVPVSSFMMIPLEDYEWFNVLRMDRLFWKILRDRKAKVSSYVFHPHILKPQLKEFEKFINLLKKENARFLSHSQFIKEHGGKNRG